MVLVMHIIAWRERIKSEKGISNFFEDNVFWGFWILDFHEKAGDWRSYPETQWNLRSEAEVGCWVFEPANVSFEGEIL
jgi:hypothetical protein